jgi:hypothetical protein
MSLLLNDDPWAVFSPNTARKKEGRGGGRRKSKCSTKFLETQPVPSLRTIMWDNLKYGGGLYDGFPTADGFLDPRQYFTDPTWPELHEHLVNIIKYHYNSNHQYAGHMAASMSPPGVDETGWWDGLPIDISGLSGQPLVDALYSSPNGWIPGAVGVELAEMESLDVFEYFNYRLMSHVKNVSGKSHIITTSIELQFLAFWTMLDNIITQGWVPTDPSVPLSGEVSNGIPTCDFQALHMREHANSSNDFLPAHCVLPHGKWVIASFPEPSGTSGFFTHLQNALKEIILRDDGVFDELMNATCFGFHWVGHTATNSWKVCIVYD